MALMIVADTHPIQNLRVLAKIEKDFGVDHKAPWAKYWIEQGLIAFEKMLEKHSGKYCFGDEITLADLCLIPQVYNAKRFNVDMSQFKNIERIDQSCADLDAFKFAHPDSQPDCPPSTK